MNRSKPRPYPIGPTTVAAALDAVLATAPDRLALFDGAKSWTYGDLDVAVERLRDRLPRERIAWSMPNCAELVIALLATMRAGVVWVALDPRLGDAERESLAKLAGVDRVIAHPDILTAASDSARPENIDPHAPALVAFTSGTTGAPKAVVHSQHNLLWPGLVSAELEPSEPGERLGTPLSLSIANMMILGPISAFLRGSTAVVMKRTDALGFADDVEHDRVTRVFVVPTMLHDLAASSIDSAKLRSLERVIAGGSAGNPKVIARFTERFGVRPTSSYGLSESPTGVVRESLDDPIGNGRGFPLPPIAVTVLDGHGEPVAQGVEGEICIGAATTGRWALTWSPMLGYHGDDQATQRALRGGVLHTGDRGKMDSEGALHVTGRLDDMIIRGGSNISPTEVEAALKAHPGVADAAVVGIPDRRLGQTVGALVTSEAEAPPDPDDLRRFVSETLTGYKVPEQIVVVPELSRTPIGKIDRAATLAILSEEHSPVIDDHFETILVQAIEDQQLVQIVRELQAQPTDDAVRQTRIANLAAALRELGRAVVEECAQLVADLAAEGIDTTPSGRLAEELDRQSPMLQLSTITLDVDSDDTYRAQTLLVARGFTAWNALGASAWEVFRRTNSATSLVRVSPVGFTTQVELSWHAGGLSRVPAALRPNARDFEAVALPKPLWPLYFLVRVGRLVTEHFRPGGRAESIGPFLGTPTSLIGPLLDMAQVDADDIVYDLGCGDGRVLIEVAKRGARGVGIEIRPELVTLANESAAAEGLTDRLDFRACDASAVDVDDATVIYLFLPAEVIETIMPGLVASVRPGTRIVVHEQAGLPSDLGGERRALVTRGGVTIGNLWTTS